MTAPSRPRQSATAAEQVTWLRSQIRLYARDLATQEMFGKLDPAAATDRLGAAADGFAGQLDGHVPDDVIHMAVQAEQLEAAEAVRAFSEQLRKRLHFLVRERAPSPEVWAAASAICERHRIYMPDWALRDVLVGIVVAVQPFHGRRRYVA
jgi:hypothetical protein